MKTQMIKQLVESVAAQTGSTEVEILSRWQGELAKKGNEEGIDILHDIKMEYAAETINHIMTR